MKKKIILSLIVAIAAIVMSLTVIGNTTVKAEEASVNKDTFASYFTKVGDTSNGVNLVDYVKSISYGEFTADKFSGGGVMVETRNKASDLVDIVENKNDTNPPLINLPGVKYSTGVKFNGAIDLSDNTSSTTLLELAFPGSNDQAKGIKIIIEDAFDSSKYIALFIWHAYGNWDAVGGKAWMAAAAGTWEKTDHSSDDVNIDEAGFDTEDYDGADYGAGFYPVGDQVNGAGSSAGNGEGCFLNYAEDGHTKTDIRLNSSSANSVKVQFDNANGLLSINGVHVRDFKNYSADTEHFFDGFTNDLVKVSIGVIRTTRCSTDEFTKFCIMNIDGNNLKADESGNIQYTGAEYNVAPESGLIASGNTAFPAPKHFDAYGVETTTTTGVTYTITDPNNAKVENYEQATYDFDLIGTYKVEYFVNGSSVGTAEFKTAAKDAEDKLVELESFDISAGLYAGKKITLADFTVKDENETVMPLTAATVTVLKGSETLATETADANWSYTLTEKGELTFKVSNDSYTVKANQTVLPGVFPTAAIENGSVSIDGKGSAIGLNSDLLLFTITPAEGYRLKSLMVNGQDVTAEVEDGEYELVPESMENNITYTVTFEAIPKFTVTYKDGETTVGTVADVVEGTLFKDVEAPAAPTKVGYTFAGWSLDANSAITADVIATAQFEAITYTITYNLDGGTNSTENKATYTIEDAFTLANPTKEGYKFLGWSNEAGTSVAAVALGTTGNLTFTAHWEADEPVNPTTQPPVTQAPTTQPPVTQAPTTQPPATEAPATQAPVTEAPATEAPATTAPATTAPAQPGKKKGCKSFVETLPIFAFLLVPAAIVVIKRKREE